MTITDRTPAFVLGDSFTALGVLQILGRQQIPVFVLTEANSAIRSSRYFAEFTVDGTRCDSPDDLPSFLESLVIERAVLIPCSDEYALAVSRLPEFLQSRFPSSSPDTVTINRLVDKLQLAELMRTLSLPHAESIAVDSADLVRELAAESGRHGFLKPRNSQPFFRDFATKAFWYESEQNALELYEKAVAGGHAMIWQEYVDGPPTRHFYVEGYIDRHGETKATYARRRLRM